MKRVLRSDWMVAAFAVAYMSVIGALWQHMATARADPKVLRSSSNSTDFVVYGPYERVLERIAAAEERQARALEELVRVAKEGKRL